MKAPYPRYDVLDNDALDNWDSPSFDDTTRRVLDARLQVPLATVSAPHGKSPPCVYRGFCNFGCSTNAKQSALIVWIPRAIRAGGEIRDLAMAGRIDVDKTGRATGVHYHHEGTWHF